MRIYHIFETVITLVLSTGMYSQSVAINNDGSAADASAMLDIKSTTKGLLIPRMTTAQRTTIVTPALGLKVFDTDTKTFWFFNGLSWNEISSGSSTNYWTLNGADIFNNNAGNVGIGTNSPTSKLSVQTPLNTTGFTHIGGSNEIIVNDAIGGVSASFGTATNHAFRIKANDIGRLHIYPAGEVIVGDNTTPSFGKFTVQTLNNSYGISHLGEGGNILATRMGGTSAGIGTFSNTNMRVFCNGASVMIFDAANGNVGIGTETTNLYKLSVNGNIRSKEVVVESGWADYVFDKDYRLRSLEELEKFIQQNKHLPNIPSAKEIEEKGLQLGETQKLMMEKIEELTLYMIKADKQLKDAHQEITSLKKELADLKKIQIKNDISSRLLNSK